VLVLWEQKFLPAVHTCWVLAGFHWMDQCAGFKAALHIPVVKYYWTVLVWVAESRCWCLGPFWR